MVTIQCSLSNGLPNKTMIVGYGNQSVDEARERIPSAFADSKLSLLAKRITINLGPADVPKEGSIFDLGVATAILAATGQVHDPLDNTALHGELGLDGDVRPIRGITGKIIAGKQHGRYSDSLFLQVILIRPYWYQT